MTPGALDLPTIFIGAAWEGIAFVCEGVDGEPVDLTDCTPQAHVRKEHDGALVLNLAPVFTNAAEGAVTIPEIAGEDTAGLPRGRFRWDLFLIDEDGKRRGPFVSGTVRIEPSITKPA